ncbi:unnamed protein product, partial [Urochloa humidicola]
QSLLRFDSSPSLHHPDRELMASAAIRRCAARSLQLRQPLEQKLCPLERRFSSSSADRGKQVFLLIYLFQRLYGTKKSHQ